MINDNLLSVTGGDLITYLNGSEGTATSINQAWMDYLTREGYTTGTLNDRLYNKLRDDGFTGTLADMLTGFWSTPQVNYVARLDGATQYWQLSEAIVILENHRIELDMFNVTQTGTRMGILSDPILQDSLRLHDSGELRFREGSPYIADISINDQPYIQQPLYPYSSGLNNVKSLMRAGNSASFNIIGATHNNDSFRYYLNGGVRNIRHYDENNNLLHEIPLTNKAQGATQLATVGSVNATMINYTEAVWEEV